MSTEEVRGEVFGTAMAVSELKESGFIDERVGMIQLTGAGDSAFRGDGRIWTATGLGTLLLNSVRDAGVDGLLRAIVQHDVPEADAAFLVGELKAGRCLVLAAGSGRAGVEVVFARHGGYSRGVMLATQSR